jgi:hypothetical protein
MGGNLAEVSLKRLHIILLDVRTLAPEKRAPTRIEERWSLSKTRRQPHLRST